MRVLRNLYDWTMHWARHPKATWALLAIAFAESSFFPIPPDVLLIAMAVASPALALRYAGVAALGSLLGGIAGYLIGAFVFEAVGQPIVDFYHAQEVMEQIGRKYESYAFLTVFTAAFTPVPYKVITISAGFFQISFLPFLVASAMGRALRFFAVAMLIRVYGESITAFIDKYFNLLSIAFTVLLIGGYLGVTYLL